MKKLKNFLRKYFITGLLVVVPISATVFVLKAILEWIDSILGNLPAQILGIQFPGLGIVTLLLIIFLIGMISANYFGNRLVSLWDRFMHRLPIVRGIYSTVQQVMETFSTNHNFKGVGLVEYPRTGCWSVGFVTGEVDEKSLGLTGTHLSVFVPTTPNPTAGFLLILPEAEVRMLDMTVQQGMKFIVSLGLVSIREEDLKKLKGTAPKGKDT